MRWLLLATALVAAPATAQIATPRPLNSGTVATKAEVQAAADTAATALASACPPSSAVPPMEAITATAGSAVTCRRSDAVQPRITRAAAVTTDSAGNWSVTWSTALATAPVVIPVPVNASAQPIVCNVATRTMTGATGRCWLARTLPATLIAVGALISFDVFGSAAASIPVQVFAIPMTQ